LLTQELMRRALYVQLRPGGAALGDALWLALSVGLLALVRRAGGLSETSVFAVLGAASAGAILVFLLLSRPRWGGEGVPRPGEAIWEHWRYGRWALGVAGLNWASTNALYLLAPLWLALEGTASVKALVNLASPGVYAVVAVSEMLVPVFARRYREGVGAEEQGSAKIMALLLAGAAVYSLALLLFGAGALRLLYGPIYAHLASLMPLVSVVPTAAAAAAVWSSLLRARERIDGVFWARLPAAMAALAGGVVLMRVLGVRGALLAVAGSYLVAAVGMYIAGRQTRRSSRD
jgi:O-antigen/teichoic acid export membrane protein